MYLVRYKIALMFFFLPYCLKSQFIEKKNYPKGYFCWPVEAKIAIVANFGELRPNHYHMGLDCKTDQRENVPVVAAAEGYIARVKIEPFGFGRAIYINHPNGLTTLYAHLNEFYPQLEKYIKQQQYERKSWNIYIDVPENLFPVKKGQFIAKSGNTGGSMGAHLHFEIRDTKTDKVLNPLLFGLPIADNVAPDIYKLAVYDRRLSTYEQKPVIFSLKKVNGIYVPAGGTINIKTDRVSFAVNAFDCYNGSTNQNGIFGATLSDQNKNLLSFEMDSISYDDTRYLNAHIDYKTKSSGGSYFQHLSVLPGNNKVIYSSLPGEDGIIDLSDGDAHEIAITIFDANYNKSVLKFYIKKTEPVSIVSVPDGPLFKPGQINFFENNSVAFYLSERSIYDAFRFQYQEKNNKDGIEYQLHNGSVPVQEYFDVKIKKKLEKEDTGFVVMIRTMNGKSNFKKATYVNGWYKASFRDFGVFRLIVDHEPPAILPLGEFKDGANVSGKKNIAFAVTDNIEEIASFTALLDGKWLRFTNDKCKSFIYEFDENCAPGEHTLEIIVRDLAGNETKKTFRFFR
jgi:murein DD-endopeptidase MepM/ murein hydrolase activator NlpD